MNLHIEEKVLRPFSADGDEVLSLTEAARRLGLSVKTVSGLVARRRLRRLVDVDEPNSTKRGRVLAADVEAEIARRRERKDDSRIKRRRGRPVG